MFNRKQSALLAALAVSGLYFNVAFAGIEGPPAEYVKFLKMKPMDVMHMMDVGKKGHVTKEEFMKFHEAMFENMDKNRDGQISAQEWLGRELRRSDG